MAVSSLAGRRRFRALLAVTVVLALAALLAGCDGESRDQPAGGTPGEPVTVTRVIDGDTMVIEGGDRVRYIGIDAPEMPDEQLAGEATEQNRRLVEGRVVWLEEDVRDRDDYGRLLRYVWVDGTMVNAEMVRLGLAWSRSYPPDTGHQALLDRMEDEARAKGLGLWASSG